MKTDTEILDINFKRVNIFIKLVVKVEPRPKGAARRDVSVCGWSPFQNMV